MIWVIRMLLAMAARFQRLTLIIWHGMACDLRSFITPDAAVHPELSLLTGLYPHQAAMGWMVNKDYGLDGYVGDLSKNAVTIAQVCVQLDMQLML